MYICLKLIFIIKNFNSDGNQTMNNFNTFKIRRSPIPA